MKRIYPSLFLVLISFTASFAGPWTQKASMGGLGRHRAFSMTIGDHGYVGGGWNGNSMYYDFWDYDPATNSWTQKANLPTWLWSDPAFGIGLKGYVIDGGYTYMYSPVTNSWSIVNTNSPSATYYDQMKFVINGKGYLCDGYDIYEFNPMNNTWTPRYNISFPFFGDLAFAVGNKGYFVDVYYNDCFEYDPALNSVAMKAPLPAGNSQATSFGVNGRGYVGLGQVGPDDVQDFYEYNPATNSWRGINPLDGAARENATAFIIGNKAYVTCGTNGINMNDLWEFDNTQATGVEEISNAINVNVFPNPSVDGKFYVKQEAGAAHELTSVKVFDAGGRLVKEQVLHSGECIDMSGFANAMYSVSFYSHDALMGSRKVVLEK